MTGVIGCSQADISNEQTDKSPQGSRTAWPYIYCLELNKSLLGSPVYLILVFDLSTLVSILSLFELLKFIRLKRKKKHLLIYPPKTRQKIPGTTLLPGPCSGKNLISILVRDYIQKRRGQKTPRVCLEALKVLPQSCCQSQHCAIFSGHGSGCKIQFNPSRTNLLLYFLCNSKLTIAVCKS